MTALTSPSSSRIPGSYVFLDVDGMSCQSCSHSVEAAAKKTAGVDWASVHLEQGHAFVHFDPKVTSADVIAKAIRDAGFGAEIKSSMDY